MATKTFFGSVKAFAAAHKAIAALAALLVLATGYGTYKHFTSTDGETKYVLASAARGTLVSSVSGSGQVAAQNQTDITSQVSGDIMAVRVAPGDEVRQGDVIAEIDKRDAVAAVNNAELSLENARVAYEKAVKQAGDQAATSSSSDIAKAYQDGHNAIANASIDMPAIFSGVSDIFYDPSHSPYFSDTYLNSHVNTTAVDYKNQAGVSFDAAKKLYDANFPALKNVSPDSPASEIVSLLDTTNLILNRLLASLTATYNTVDYISDRVTGTIPAEVTTDKTALSSYVTKINNDVTTVTNALKEIEDAQTSGTTADLNMKSAELSVKQAETALDDANTALADHTIRAPYAGLIAKVPAKAGDKASVGTNIATIVTKEEMVNISLNEVDAAKVEKGQKATLTFDAIDGLTLTGHVTNVDLVGTVSQGVVSYTVEVAFDTADSRVKPGMTVNAAIITGAKTDALLVPSSAVKTSGGVSYVQVLPQKYGDAEAAAGILSASAPGQKQVETGASNDSSIEIVSGLSEGDQVVVRTVAASAKASSAPSILGGIGGARAGGNGAFRTVTR